MISPSHDGLEDEMKRDMDFIRELLLKIEETDDSLPSSQELHSGNANEAEYKKLATHLAMLIDEAKLVSGTPGPAPSIVVKNWIDLRLRWDGYDFLDSVRDPEIWAKTKKGAEEARGFTFDLLKDLAKGLVRNQIEDLTGVKL
jgi:Hypothetical protein (DUF2513)